MSDERCREKAVEWIQKNTIDGHGIKLTAQREVLYPEVSGYYIPTLLAWGMDDLALAYAKHLCSIQKPDGAWYDAYGAMPYIFDTAQILKGLLSVYPRDPEVKEAIIKGCDWLVAQMDGNGRLAAPGKDTFPPEENFYSELIHIYCLTPLVDAGKLFQNDGYGAAAKKILNYYIQNKYENIVDFSLLSHFYAYVMEGLVDLGERELALKAMNNLKKYANEDGSIPGLRNVKWVCSTGLFQLATVWYKLGNAEEGDVLFENGCKLQNESGGWFGSYPAPERVSLFQRRKNIPTYFQNEEISWANKYFLDALYWKQKMHGDE